MNRPTRSTGKPGCATVLVTLGILAFVATMLTIIVCIAIWPGEAKLTAPLLCPGDKPDAFVVADTYSSRPGETSTNFTLYCMGPRGDVVDEGFFRPFVLLTLFHAALLIAAFVVYGAVLRTRQKRGGPDADLPTAAAPP